MSQILTDAKKATQNMKCSVHNKNAEVAIKGNEIEVKACCDAFKNKISEAVKKSVTESIKKQAKDIFKGLGK